MKNIDKERRAALLYLANMQMQLKAGLYFESLGWQQRTDGRLYPPKGNHSMSLRDAVYQLEVVASGEEVTSRGGVMKTYWEVSARNGINERFACAECGYDSMSRSLDRGTIRMDCAFCGWGCFIDMEGWWHQKTSAEWEQEAEAEEYG